MPDRRRKLYTLSPEARREEARKWVDRDTIVTIGRQETAQSKFRGKVTEVLHVTFVGDVLVIESVAKRFGVRLTDIVSLSVGYGDTRDAEVHDRDAEAEARRRARAQAVGKFTAMRQAAAEAREQQAWAEPEEPF